MYLTFSAKQLITLLPLFYVVILSAIALFAQYKFTRRQLRRGTTDELVETVRDEADERAILKRSNELLMECVQALETKVDTEIVTRQRQQLEAEKERYAHEEKIERY